MLIGQKNGVKTYVTKTYNRSGHCGSTTNVLKGKIANTNGSSKVGNVSIVRLLQVKKNNELQITYSGCCPEEENVKAKGGRSR